MTKFMGGDLFSSEIPSDFKAWVEWLNAVNRGIMILTGGRKLC